MAPHAPSRAHAWTGLLVCLAAHSASAQSSLMLWPLDPLIEESQRAVALWLENRGSAPLALQIRVLAWDQPDHTDRYRPTQAVMASPPMATVAPGQRQLVRLMATEPTPDGAELAYRVLVDELPRPAAPEESPAGAGVGVRLQIRYSIPLFVSGKGHRSRPRSEQPRDLAAVARPALRWRSAQTEDGHYLVVRNDGRTHARLIAAQWVGDGEPVPLHAGLLGYVLPGADMRWKLMAPPPPGYRPQVRINKDEAPQVLPPF